MKRLFAITMVAMRTKHNHTLSIAETKGKAGYAVACSEAEAEGLAMRKCREMFPPDDWQQHSVCALEIPASVLAELDGAK